MERARAGLHTMPRARARALGQEDDTDLRADLLGVTLYCPPRAQLEHVGAMV